MNAASFSISLPSFNGNYVYPDGKASDSFDLGVQFLSIQSAELIIEASGTGGLLQICDYLFDPPQCTTHSYDAHLSWIFTPESGHDLAYGDQILTSTVTPYIFD
ncbi:MAG: hypothetical protein SVW57_15360, partial [Thermodesulfobacteriota bacterium]|nr:hypothetical protein [Thermodesulfobacteriota bacterium]